MARIHIDTQNSGQNSLLDLATFLLSRGFEIDHFHATIETDLSEAEFDVNRPDHKRIVTRKDSSLTEIKYVEVYVIHINLVIGPDSGISDMELSSPLLGVDADTVPYRLNPNIFDTLVADEWHKR